MTKIKRYEFTGETKDFYGRTLQQIRSLVTIAALDVHVGSLGGWIETESNFPHDSTAWVFPNVQACGKATFEGGTFWGGTFEGGTFEGGTFEGGTFEGGTFWSGTSTKIQPLFLAGLKWPVTITDEHMSIGCQTHPLADWWGFDDRTIAAMDSHAALKFWRIYKPILQALCAATGR